MSKIIAINHVYLMWEYFVEELEEAGEYSFTKKGTGYEQNRTLQNDIDFLRDLGAEIEALSAGLKMTSHFLPHMSEHAASLWEKIT